MTETDDNGFPQQEPELKSKSQRKREMLELQALGKSLSELSADQLSRIPLDDALRKALIELQRIQSHEARRRQLQYLGKLMRTVDTAPIRHALAGVQSGHQENTRRLHLAESWRERLVAEGDTAVTLFMARFPEAEAQHLRNLVRNARRDQEQDKNRGHGRKLFRYLRALIDAAELSADGGMAENQDA